MMRLTVATRTAVVRAAQLIHRSRRNLRWSWVAAVFVAGAVMAPVGWVATAAPAAATDCGNYPITCRSTLSTTASAAPIGSTIFITVSTGGGSDQCIDLRADPSGSSSIGDGNTPQDATTPDSGVLTWPVTYTGAAQVITYRAFFRGTAFSNNACPVLPPNDPNVQILQTVTVTWVAIGPEQNSTVTALPSTVVADGHTAATVTVVLTTPDGLAITGQQVRLTGFSPALVSPARATSGAGGQAVFSVTDASPTTTALAVGAQRFNGLTWVQLNQRARLQFVAPSQAERADSTVTASLARVTADGLSTTTITVSLADSSGPLAGHLVRLQNINGAPDIVAQQAQSDALGRALFTVSDSRTQTVTFNATDTTATGSPIVGSIQVRFGGLAGGEQGLSVLSVTASGNVSTAVSVPDDGTTAAAVYVQLRCNDHASGCNGAGTAVYSPDQGSPTGTVSGAQVALVATSSNSANVGQVLDPTNYLGQARFQVTDAVPEQVTYNAFDVTNNVQLVKVDNSSDPPTITPLKVTITFTGPGTPSPTTSTATASPSSVAADGVTASTITVTLRDNNRVLVPGRAVTLSPGTGHATFTPPVVTTNLRGVATFSTVDTRAETVSYLVTDATDNIALTSFPLVTFTAGAPSAAASTISASPATVPANGTTSSTVTVTITDQNAGPLAGKNISLAQGAGNSTIGAPSGLTNAKGVTTFSVADTHPEAVTYTATDVTDGLVLTHNTTVTFTGGGTAGNSTITANPLSIPANSLASSTVAVNLRDQNNNPVAGKVVKLRGASGQSTISPVTPGSDTTNPSGAASFSVSDGTAETVIYGATDVTDGLALPATIAVSFTGPPSGAASTVTATPSTLVADGAQATTITITVVDGVGQPIPGHVVTLAGSTGTHSAIGLVATGSNTTNAAGVATFSATDLVGETVTYSATDTSVNPQQKLFATAAVTFQPPPVVQSISPASGPAGGGTRVTITGLNLTGATAVYFGTNLATNVGVNRNGSVSVTAPAGVGIVDVTVTTPVSTSATTPADRYTYS